MSANISGRRDARSSSTASMTALSEASTSSDRLGLNSYMTGRSDAVAVERLRSALTTTEVLVEALCSDFHTAMKGIKTELLVGLGLSEAQAMRKLQEEHKLTSSDAYIILDLDPEHIGYFSGKKGEYLGWFESVEAWCEHNPAPEWRARVLGLVPVCLRGNVKTWWAGILTPAERRAYLHDWPGFKSAITALFGYPDGELRRVAYGRKWEVGEEDITTYYFAKLRLLKHAEPTWSEAYYMQEIRDGLPLQLRLQVDEDKGSCEQLLKALRSLEPNFKELGVPGL